MDASRAHRPLSIQRLTACIRLEPAVSKGSLFEGRKRLSPIFPHASPVFFVYLASPGRKINSDSR